MRPLSPTMNDVSDIKVVITADAEVIRAADVKAEPQEPSERDDDR